MPSKIKAPRYNVGPIQQGFRIPCFAHQELDPERFPHAVGLATGGPISVPDGSGSDDSEGLWEGSSEGESDGESGSDNLPSDPRLRKKVILKRKRDAKPKPDNTYKRMKVPGGRPPIAKKVTADLDSDDELILRMKNAKYLEKDIAQRLVDEGRIAYNPKTIGTRYARIMRAIQKRQDALLDAELTEWHEGDDEALEQAIDRANKEVAQMHAKVDARKWRIVALEMKKIKPVVNFSQNACRNRYRALLDGTAKPTPESILNPDDLVKARINSRLEKEKRIEADAELFKDNLEGNAWTSHATKFF